MEQFLRIRAGFSFGFAAREPAQVSALSGQGQREVRVESPLEW
jgi:hypothetical protein